MKLRGVSSGTHRRKEKKDGRGTKPCGSTWHEHGSWTATGSRTQDAGCIVGVLCIRARHFQPLENSPGVFSSHGNLRTLPFFSRTHCAPRIQRKCNWHGTCFPRNDGVFLRAPRQRGIPPAGTSPSAAVEKRDPNPKQQTTDSNINLEPKPKTNQRRSPK